MGQTARIWQGEDLGFFDRLKGRQPDAPGDVPSESDAATAVWNRACDAEWPPTSDAGDLDGDTRLAYVIMFDSYSQGDGVLAAMGSLGSEGTRAAVAGFRWLGRPDLAETVERGWASLVPKGVEWPPDTDMHFDVLGVDSMDDKQSERFDKKVEALDSKYCETADGLNSTFEEYYRQHPDEFAPVN